LPAGELMKCHVCGVDASDVMNFKNNVWCIPCLEKAITCHMCGAESYNLVSINNKKVCSYCNNKIAKLYKLKSDPRIKQLAETPILQNKVSNNEGIDDFAQIGNEALTTALYLKNFEILGLSPSSTLDDIRERCKALLQTWHPDLHKNDPERQREAIQNVTEFKKAYETIKAEKERPYKILELKYGASHQEIIQSYDFLKTIYNPVNFNNEPILCEKIKQKFIEITAAFNELMQSHKGSNPHRLKTVKPISSIEPQQSIPTTKSALQTNVRDKDTTITNAIPSQLMKSDQSKFSNQVTTSSSSNNGPNNQVSSSAPHNKAVRNIKYLGVLLLVMALPKFCSFVGGLRNESKVINELIILLLFAIISLPLTYFLTKAFTREG